MANFQYKQGLGNSAAYQVSGKPFITGAALPDPAVTPAPVEVEFPTVTKSITFVPDYTGGGYYIGFSAAGVSGSLGTKKFFFQNDPTATTPLTLDVKATSVFLQTADDGGTTTAWIYASLTSIGTGSIVNNWSGSAGVG